MVSYSVKLQGLNRVRKPAAKNEEYSKYATNMMLHRPLVAGVGDVPQTESYLKLLSSCCLLFNVCQNPTRLHCISLGNPDYQGVIRKTKKIVRH